MDERTFKSLELDSLVALLERYTQSPLGRRRVLALLPSTDRLEIETALDRTTECADYLASGEQFGLSGIADPEAAFAQLQIEGTSLDPHQILVLERLIAIGMGLRAHFSDPAARDRYPRLGSLIARIPDLRRVLSSIGGKILPGGEIDDNASPELRAVRREIQGGRNRIHRALESIMRGQGRAVQEEVVTFRNGRFVIPVRTDARAQVPGVMHGLSSSGQTTFVEPLTVIEQNNELVRLREQEEIEIARILLAISDSLRIHLPAMQEITDIIGEIDFAQAKARLSAEFRCVRPQMVDRQTLRLRDARHLLLDRALRASGQEAIPISLDLDESHRLMIISGPNAGGKTVVLKTVGLIALTAQMGLHVPAREARLPVFSQILADIGDQQSIAANLSTFTAHMLNISQIAERAAPPALLLLDEVGTGTDPDEGAALAVAIVDYFRQAGVLTIATTHYNPLKIWASQVHGVLNASVEFDEKTLRPTYRLITGVAGASSGLEIARRMNVPTGILDAAHERVQPEQLQASQYLKRLKALVDEQESLRAALEEERRVTAEKFEQLNLQFDRREALRREEFARELERVIREFSAEGERLIRGLKDRAEAARLRKTATARTADLRRAARTRLEEVVPAARKAEKAGQQRGQASDSPAEDLAGTEKEIGEGDRVRIRSIDREGVVESISGDTYTVMVGILKFRAKREELQALGPSTPLPTSRAEISAGIGPGLDAGQDFSNELKIIGLTADEARDRVDKFLDQAYLSGVESVRIIHGHGKGILRRAVAELLAGHGQVERFEPAPSDQGGAGATIVTMRK
jgi:DNA mismatch repair protein MutS2